MKNEITYEWTLETIDDGDIIDSDFADSLTFDKSHLPGNDLGLCRVVGNEHEGIIETTWAYVKDGKLQTHFSDARGSKLYKVPAKFHTELRKYLSYV